MKLIYSTDSTLFHYLISSDRNICVVPRYLDAPGADSHPSTPRRDCSNVGHRDAQWTALSFL